MGKHDQPPKPRSESPKRKVPEQALDESVALPVEAESDEAGQTARGYEVLGETGGPKRALVSGESNDLADETLIRQRAKILAVGSDEKDPRRRRTAEKIKEAKERRASERAKYLAVLEWMLPLDETLRPSREEQQSQLDHVRQHRDHYLSAVTEERTALQQLLQLMEKCGAWKVRGMFDDQAPGVAPGDVTKLKQAFNDSQYERYFGRTDDELRQRIAYLDRLAEFVSTINEAEAGTRIGVSGEPADVAAEKKDNGGYGNSEAQAACVNILADMVTRDLESRSPREKREFFEAMDHVNDNAPRYQYAVVVERSRTNRLIDALQACKIKSLSKFDPKNPGIDNQDMINDLTRALTDPRSQRHLEETIDDLKVWLKLLVTMENKVAEIVKLSAADEADANAAVAPAQPPPPEAPLSPLPHEIPPDLREQFARTHDSELAMHTQKLVQLSDVERSALTPEGLVVVKANLERLHDDDKFRLEREKAVLEERRKLEEILRDMETCRLDQLSGAAVATLTFENEYSERAGAVRRLRQAIEDLSLRHFLNGTTEALYAQLRDLEEVSEKLKEIGKPTIFERIFGKKKRGEVLE